jgi:hypothetical protein
MVAMATIVVMAVAESRDVREFPQHPAEDIGGQEGKEIVRNWLFSAQARAGYYLTSAPSPE